MLILTILKWIGIILLIVLGLLILTLFYAIFSKQSYAIKANFDNDTYIVSLHDSLFLYYFSFYRKNKKNHIEISLFFRLLKIKNNKNNTEKKDDTKKKKKKEKNKKQNKKQNNKSKKRIISILNDESLKPGLKHIFKEFVIVLKKISPKRFVANLVFSTGEPDNTGYVTAALSVIPWVNVKTAHIIPDFNSEDAFISGKAKIIGGIRLFSFIVFLFKIIKYKASRRLILKVLKQ